MNFKQFITELGDKTKDSYLDKAKRDMMIQLLKKGNLPKAAKSGRMIDKLTKGKDDECSTKA